MPLIQGLNKGVYRWVNKVNGKVYVGSATKTLQKRHDRYVKDFAKGRCHNRHLLQAWQKYGGRDAFRFEVLEVCETNEECLIRETWWIAHYDSTDHDKGYNVCKQGKNQAGAKRTDETKALMSKKAKVRGMPKEAHEAAWKATKGKPKTTEHKAKTKATHWTKRPDAEEIKARIAAKNSLNSPTQEQRDQISATLKGRKQSEESKAKKKAAWANKTEEEKAAIRKKLSDAKKGYVKTPEHRARLAEAARRQHARRRGEEGT